MLVIILVMTVGIVYKLQIKILLVVFYVDIQMFIFVQNIVMMERVIIL